MTFGSSCARNRRSVRHWATLRSSFSDGCCAEASRSGGRSTSAAQQTSRYEPTRNILSRFRGWPKTCLDSACLEACFLSISSSHLTRPQMILSGHVENHHITPRWAWSVAPEPHGVSRPGEFHPQPLAEPSVRLSPHSAPIRQTCRPKRSASERRGPHFPLPSVVRTD